MFASYSSNNPCSGETGDIEDFKVQIDEGQDALSLPSLIPALQIKMANMIVESCSQERSYSAFYIFTGGRFCKLNRVWTEHFESAFGNYYTTTPV
jgi:pre-mRNA-splicing factor CWC22